MRKDLAVTGPYALVRNPLYLGNTLVLTGAGVASELAWFLPVVVSWALAVYGVTALHEERRLTVRFGGAYLAYRARVPPWLPRSVLPSSPASGSASSEASGVFALQAAYAVLALLPFVVKEINPLGIWPPA
jgi:hypothetical protein